MKEARQSLVHRATRTFAVRPGVGVLILWAFVGGCAAPGGSVTVADRAASHPAERPAVSLSACLWTWSRDGANEWRYAVDVDRETLLSASTDRRPAGEKPSCARLEAERKKHDAQAYRRLAQHVESRRGAADLDTRLVRALAWIEQSTGWGATRSDAIDASPDGAYVLVSARGQALLLTRIDTLETRVLAQPHRDLPTPVAWSADSRLLAFATPGTAQLHLYSVEQGAVVATQSGVGPWVAALSWSPDRQRVAAFGFQNRRMNKTPLGLLGAAAGHPEYRNDGVLSVYRVADGRHFSLVLQRGMSEMSSPRVLLEWQGAGS